MRFGLRHLALIVTTVLALGLNASALLRQPAAVDQAANRAGLVISFGDGRVQQQCIPFTEDEITGYDLLRKSTLPVVANQFGGLGAAICKIDTVGCSYPQEDCFCQSVNRPSTEQRSWFFWTLQNGVWVSANSGTSSARVTNGVVHGWVWGPGNPGDAVKTFDQICNTAPTAIPTAISADMIGGGQVISNVIATPVPTAVVANMPAVPVAPPTPDVTVVAVVAVLVPTATPIPPASATVAPAPTETPMPTLTPTATPEPTLSSASTTTTTFTSALTYTITSTATPAPTATTEPTPSSTSTITTTHTSTFTYTITSTSTATTSSTSVPTPMPTSTPPPPETPPASNPLGYVLFGVIALGLAGGIVLTRVRK